jgi:hypothetical protein
MDIPFEHGAHWSLIFLIELISNLKNLIVLGEEIYVYC